ncbi:MAG: Ig-like domain-containing protein, partial [Candidatus Marinimicrobia bacterium]|nr:Ig-like domain-containing protein [Candidatus Neomarinimicrobiota bacterium]
MKNFKIVPIIFLIAILVLQLSCDERTPTEDTSSNYTMTMTTQPVAGNDLSGENVGEDILGDVVTTRVSAILKDENDKAIEEALISFSSKKENSSYGQMDPQSGYTDENGTVTALFKDPGDASAFGESKALLKAEYAQNQEVFAQTLIDVYPDTMIWPYSIAITPSINQIFKTTSPQSSTLTIYVYNKLSNPVQSVYVDLTTDVGSFGDAQQKEYTFLTDNLGRGTVEFNHNDELGLATITAYYSHGAFTGTQSDSTQVLIGTNYNITLSQYPLSQDSLGNWIIVGEDISGDKAMTRLIATITDNSGNPVQGEQIIFSAEAQGNIAGTITTNTNVTNSQGQVFAYFDDNGTVYQDLGETEDFEGVTCTAFIGDLTGKNNLVQFSVFTESVWPYQLSLNTDVNEITLDNGVTNATINGRLLNGLSQPVPNVILSFTADRGYLESQVTTDSTGNYNLIFQDLGEPADVGLATIIGSFSHPGFSSYIQETEHISIVTNYNMTLESYPVSLNESGNPVLVGEDVAGDNSRTRIVATVTDEAGNAVEGQSILFTAEGTSGTDVGTFDTETFTTNSEGKAKAYFLDDGNAYQDQSGTEDFEGVTVTAFIGDETGESQSTQFSVYYESDIWPYQLSLNTDVDEITLDNGQTEAIVSGRLLNGLNNAVGTVTLSFSTDRGYINSQVTTDSNGDYNLTFQDLGEPSDVGMASIIGSFTHPGFDSTITKTAQVAIVTNYSLALTSYSVSLNENGNSVIVGEDVAGDNAHTRIVATVSDQAGNFISGQSIYFNAEVLGDQNVGSFDAEVYTTNDQGKVYAYFLDNGTSYQDQSGTEDFEGVLVTAFIGDETGESESVPFSVFDASDVWPYQLSLNSDVDEITLDNGQTQAVVSGRLLNGLNTVVNNVTLSFSAD